MDQKLAIQTEQLRQLLAKSNASLLASTFLAGLLAYIQYGVINPEVVVVWLGLMLVIAVSRFVLAQTYKRSPVDDVDPTQTRLIWFRTGVLISGLVWGSAGYFLYPTHDANHQLFLIFMVTGLTAGAVVSYSAEVVSAVGFCILVLAPVIVRLFIEGTEIAIAMDVAAIIYIVFMFVTLRYISNNVTENIALNFKGIEREALIQESKERFRVLVEWTPEAIIVHRAGKIIYVNPAAIKLFGASSDQELMAKPVLALIHPDYRQIVLDRIKQNAIDGFAAPMIVEKFLKMDGTAIDVEVQGTSIMYDGEPAIHAAVHDISERKRAENALHYSEQRFRDVSEAAGEYVWEIDANMVYTYVSHQSSEVKGYSPNELLGHTPMEFMPVDDIAPVGEIVNRAIANKSPFRLQHRDITHSGSTQWEEVNGVPFYDAAGAVIGLRGTGLNITERKLAEERLRVAAVAFETHDAIMITDINANIIRVNQAFQNITGYSAEEVLGKNPRILSSGREDKEFFKGMWQQLLSSGNWTGEIWDKHKSGKIFPKWMTITAVKDGAGKITEFVAIFNDITSRKQAEEEIRNLAYYDGLTKLPNRRLLMDRLSSALSSSARSNHYGALLFLDMDRFKTLNDSLGHDYGDLMLIEVAKRIQSCVREVDTVARLGGDEFVILLEEVDTHPEETSRKVALIAEKIRAALTVPYQLKGNEQHSSPSIGVCLYRGNDATVDALLKYADMAMYQVKDTGRNAVRFFDPAMQLSVVTRAALEADLRHAIPDRQLQLHYQIQMDSELNPIGAEALVRWMHPKRGMVSPMQFIPIAEESSLILDIGGWVLNTACRQLSMWSKAEQTKHLTLAVNVSARQFKQADFVEKVADTLRTYDVDASRLKLELTESVVLNDVTDVISKMHALKAMRVKLSMDDFGTGYSSLSYLKQLPLDQIKIDQSFVRDMTSDPNDIVMVQTIIDMAKNFRLNVIAEGVETIAQQLLLKDMGCTAYQGYLFSKPVPIEQFEALLNQV